MHVPLGRFLWYTRQPYREGTCQPTAALESGPEQGSFMPACASREVMVWVMHPPRTAFKHGPGKSACRCGYHPKP